MVFLLAMLTPSKIRTDSLIQTAPVSQTRAVEIVSSSEKSGADLYRVTVQRDGWSQTMGWCQADGVSSQ
jgi:hypothetical protein